jgi:FtsP/CotA-like multicopper oxidase with cupredoxin domain
MDGVPGLSFNRIAPDETFIYRFPVHQSGTDWYHSHSAYQEQTGLYGPIVIEPRGGYARPFDRDYVVLLSDWSDENPNTIARDAWATRLAEATDRLVAERLLLAEDGDRLVAAERESWDVYQAL